MNKQILPTGDTIYQIGSITKIFTSLFLFHLIQQGVVSLNSQVGDFFNSDNPPEFRLVIDPHNKARNITFHSLATHASGLPREAPTALYSNLTEAQVLDAISKVPSISI